MTHSSPSSRATSFRNSLRTLAASRNTLSTRPSMSHLPNISCAQTISRSTSSRSSRLSFCLPSLSLSFSRSSSRSLALHSSGGFTSGPSRETFTSKTPSRTSWRPVRPSLRYSVCAQSRTSESSESSNRARRLARRSPAVSSGSRWGGMFEGPGSPIRGVKGSFGSSVVDFSRASGQQMRERR
ncbi:hypothetical protein BGW80DRAFT_131912 [Lactifluus volemus]|nr:hypothetical protein BGW80DRAFT_131912 [Lactifluus volemus]